MYANIRGLAKAYYENGYLNRPDDFADFMLGFNKSHPLCDFIDAGNHKEAADRKLQGKYCAVSSALRMRLIERQRRSN